MKKPLLISCAVVCIIVASIYIYFAYFFTFYVGRDHDELKQTWSKNIIVFNDFALYFLAQKEINNAGISLHDKQPYKILNEWDTTHEDIQRWKKNTSEYTVAKYIYLSSLLEVLAIENIKKQNYEKIEAFLREYEFDGIGKDKTANSFDLSSGQTGLRYCVELECQFHPKEEYIYVEKLDEHWYLFETDWN